MHSWLRSPTVYTILWYMGGYAYIPYNMLWLLEYVFDLSPYTLNRQYPFCGTWDARRRAITYRMGKNSLTPISWLLRVSHRLVYTSRAYLMRYGHGMPLGRPLQPGHSTLSPMN